MIFTSKPTARISSQVKRIGLTSILAIIVFHSGSSRANEPSGSGLIGIWQHESRIGNTYINFRKDYWYVAVHIWSDTQSALVTAGHWAEHDGKLVLQRLGGGDELEKVAPKRSITVSEVTDDSLVLGRVPLQGERYKKLDEFDYFNDAHLVKLLYTQFKIVLPEEPALEAETHVSMIGGRTRIHLYLAPGGEFLGRVRDGKDPLKGKWEKSGDFLTISGVTEKDKVAILMELKMTNGKYKLFNFEANGEQSAVALNSPPFEKVSFIEVSADDAEPELEVKFFKQLYGYLTGHSKSIFSDTVYREGNKEEAEHYWEDVVKADVNSGEVTVYSKYLGKEAGNDGTALNITNTQGHFSAFFGAHLTRNKNIRRDKDRLGIGVITNKSPITTQWYSAKGSFPAGDEQFRESVRLADGSSTSTFRLKRNGKLFVESSSKSHDIESDKSLDDILREFKAAYEEMKAQESQEK